MAQAAIKRDRFWAVVRTSVIVATLLVALPVVASIVGSVIGRGVFGEPAFSGHSSNLSLPSEPWRIFLMMLAGAGIAEETPYRLVVLSLVWRLTSRRGVAIVVSALVFGLYHLTPLNSWYDVYWQAPITQLVTATTGGLVLGYVFSKRGYETAVLGHTLGNTVVFSLFAAD